jgi:hypothetical protein
MKTQSARQSRVKHCNRALRPLREVIQPRDNAPKTLGRMKKNRQEAEADRLSEPVVNEGTKKPRRLLGFASFCEVYDRFQAAKKAEAEAESQGQS